MVRAPPLLSPLSSFEHCMVLCPRDSQLCDVCANPHHWTPEQTFTFAQSALWASAYSKANSLIWDSNSKTQKNSCAVLLLMNVRFYSDTLFSVIPCLKCSVMLCSLCSVCKIQKHYKRPFVQNTKTIKPVVQDTTTLHITGALLDRNFSDVLSETLTSDGRTSQLSNY